MTTEILIVGNWIVLEVFTGVEYEYYTRDFEDRTDVFNFQFGVTEKMSRAELRRTFAHWNFERGE